MHLFLLGAQAQVTVFGSKEAAERASSALGFLLQAPGNCLKVVADMPANSPSDNLAALWIRALFHDAGTWDPTTKTGGLGGSLISYQNETINAGLPESLVTRFKINIQSNISDADLIAIGAVVSVGICGGPNISYRPGRRDTKAVSPNVEPNKLPLGNERLSTVRVKMQKLGFTDEEMIAIITGSHSMGGVHARISPELTNETFVPFDATPGVFDNDVFKRTLRGRCPVPVDCDLANDPNLRPIVQRFADNQDQFFAVYQIAFKKLMNLNNAPLGNELTLPMTVHANLLKEGSVNLTGAGADVAKSSAIPLSFFSLLVLLIN